MGKPTNQPLLSGASLASTEKQDNHWTESYQTGAEGKQQKVSCALHLDIRKMFSQELWRKQHLCCRSSNSRSWLLDDDGVARESCSAAVKFVSVLSNSFFSQAPRTRVCVNLNGVTWHHPPPLHAHFEGKFMKCRGVSPHPFGYCATFPTLPSSFSQFSVPLPWTCSWLIEINILSSWNATEFVSCAWIWKTATCVYALQYALEINMSKKKKNVGCSHWQNFWRPGTFLDAMPDSRRNFSHR